MKTGVTAGNNTIVLNNLWKVNFNTRQVENLKTGFCDNFIFYGSGRETMYSSCVAYDFPYSIPKYVKATIKKLCILNEAK